MWPFPGAYGSLEQWAYALCNELSLRDGVFVDFLVGRKQYTPGTVGAGSFVTTTVSVPQAVPGMFAMASFSTDLSTVRLLPQVKATGEVEVMFYNFGTTAVSLGPGVLRVRVFQNASGE